MPLPFEVRITLTEEEARVLRRLLADYVKVTAAMSNLVDIDIGPALRRMLVVAGHIHDNLQGAFLAHDKE